MLDRLCTTCYNSCSSKETHFVRHFAIYFIIASWGQTLCCLLFIYFTEKIYDQAWNCARRSQDARSLFLEKRLCFDDLRWWERCKLRWLFVQASRYLLLDWWRIQNDREVSCLHQPQGITETPSCSIIETLFVANGLIADFCSFSHTRIFIMTALDWINVARCNQQRMMQDKIYTYRGTCKHDVFIAHWQTTNAALKLAQRASILNIAWFVMYSIASVFAKICACTALCIGAPLIAASAVDFTTSQINRDLEYRACLRTAQLDHVDKNSCVR